MAGSLHEAVSAYGKAAKAKLSNPSAKGEPEDQLRAPLERLFEDLAVLSGLKPGSIAAVGEASLRELRTRPDYAITRNGALVGYVEVKAPGKGANPKRFKGHDKAQWDRLQTLPNLLYTDGNAFSLWRDGTQVGETVGLIGDVESSGAALDAPAKLLTLFDDFFRWDPIPPRTAKELAAVTARLCRLLREEVTEQLGLGSEALTALAEDWRKLLFPEATDAEFADGYAQAVTFGLLMARAQNIPLDAGLHRAAASLGRTSTLVGGALDILTQAVEREGTLKTSIRLLVRILEAVDWAKISKGDSDAWLYFYEDFLEVYDNHLRKRTGSYYTPTEVVEPMTRWVDEALRTHFGVAAGLASEQVTLADPAVGTGTFVLGVLRRIAFVVGSDQGPGAVPAAITGALERIFAFELQFGPFAVAQLRVLAEVAALAGLGTGTAPRMFVADTLANPDEDTEWLPSTMKAIGESRRQANAIKRKQPITIVLGNPPYKEKASGRGGWIEAGSPNASEAAPLAAWMPPAEWGVSAHAKHLYNLYVYFWRWATWKVFEHEPGRGIVCFITVAGFLNGPGFQRMRAYLREECDHVWVVDCSPEGHQPEVSSRIFQGVQQPVCIVLAARTASNGRGTPAEVRYRRLSEGDRSEKFAALAQMSLADIEGWELCDAGWRAPFLPAAGGEWSRFVPLEELFADSDSGVMPGRTWVIAPDAESLRQRWRELVRAKPEDKELLFHPHLRQGKPGDRHLRKDSKRGLAGHEYRAYSVANDHGEPIAPTPYAFRSFDRQWILPDSRLINQPNPGLWAKYSDRQVYLTALSRHSPSAGPAVTFTALLPDIDHYHGRGGRVFPLWQDPKATKSNVRAGLLVELSERLDHRVRPEDVMAYIAAVAAHPSFTVRFEDDLRTPGIRVPLTADPVRFAEAVALGREVLWLHTFGERYADAKAGRPPGPPRLPNERAPRIPREGAIPRDAERMPDTIGYDITKQRLLVGAGYVDNVPPAVWRYEVSGKQVLGQWFSYRSKTRERPLIGDRRAPSRLTEVQPDHWLPEYTSELLNLLHVLGRLVELEPLQAKLLDAICAGPLVNYAELTSAGVLGAETKTTGEAHESAKQQALAFNED